MRIRFGVWTIAATIVATVLFVLALNNDVYEATSPHWLTWHVVLRKAYSIGAFALVAYLFRRSLEERGATRFTARCIVGTAIYSAAIEVGQFATGGREGLGWNAFDILCGAIGGALATTDLWLRAPRRTRARSRPRTE